RLSSRVRVISRVVPICSCLVVWKSGPKVTSEHLTSVFPRLAGLFNSRMVKVAGFRLLRYASICGSSIAKGKREVVSCENTGMGAAMHRSRINDFILTGFVPLIGLRDDFTSRAFE